jgi:hypothetical protein
VRESLIAFLELVDYEDAVRDAVSLGGDSDTMACIAGGVAQAFYGAVPDGIVAEVLARLPLDFLGVMELFESPYGSANEDFSPERCGWRKIGHFPRTTCERTRRA